MHTTTRYQILQPVHEFDKGQHRGADEFPPGTDFDRLLRLKVIHPADGSPVPVAENDLQGWKDRAAKAEERVRQLEQGQPSDVHLEQINDLKNENARLVQAVAEAKEAIEAIKTDYDRKLTQLGTPGEAIKAAVAERDAAIAERDELLERMRLSGQPGAKDGGSTPDVKGTEVWTVAKIMQLDVPTIDAALAALGVDVPGGANKQQKAQLLAGANYAGPI